MQPTSYPHVNDFLEILLSQLRNILGDKLIGLYVHGSLVKGDFDDDISDIDLMAATSSVIDESDFNALQKMHNDLVAAHQQWIDRLEIAYMSLRALNTFKTETSKIGIISPGEPFQMIDAGKDWLLNWYFVREYGVTLFGPRPDTIIEPTSRAEFIQTVKEQAAAWRLYIKKAQSRLFQAYAILTMCRSLYSVTHGEQVSKIQAARWAEQELPEWAWLIRNAVAWRKGWREKVPDPGATLPDTQRFVHVVIDQILG